MSWKVMFGEIKEREEDREDDDGNKYTVLARYSDTEVSLDDLAPEVFAAIAKAVDLELTDTGIYTFPRESTEVAYRIVCAAAEHAGVEPPPRPTRMGDTRAIKQMLEQTEDIGNQPMMGGLPPEPSEVGSGSSSTSPATTTGPEPSPEPSPSAGC